MKNNSSANIMIVGVGGQGSLLASKVLGTVAKLKKYDVKVSEVHGMAQRGGSVVTYVKMGPKVYSPIIEEGQADIIVAFEKIEALRWVTYLKKDGTMIVNDQRINPASVAMGIEKYPDGALDEIKSRRENVVIIKAKDIAKECGSVKVINIAMLGLVARHSEIEKELWIEAIRNNVPEKFLEINIKAFEMGYVYK